MLGLVSLVSNGFALVTKALGLLRDWALYAAGRKAQVADDLKETMKEGQDAAKVEADVARSSDSDVDARLQQYSRKP